ncbi:hypothetical protein FQN57_002546 [Myotisia sp. PD_48]|nr:hypothetical protein FQN57_002546 [Myotisia sp. PD_48]
MKFSNSVIALAAASLASAAATEGSLPHVPECSANCLVSAITNDGCSSLTDFKCHCSVPDLPAKVAPCVKEKCGIEDQIALSNAVVAACSAAGAPIKLPPVDTGYQTATPTDEYPSSEPTGYPTSTEEPTDYPTSTVEPTYPTETEEPTEYPTGTEEPTEYPTGTDKPTDYPTGTDKPTDYPTDYPSGTDKPTDYPTDEPTYPTGTGTGGPYPTGTGSPTGTGTPTASTPVFTDGASGLGASVGGIGAILLAFAAYL